MNISILSLLDFCKKSNQHEKVNINSCDTWLTARFVQSGLEQENISNADIHANFFDVHSSWVNDNLEEEDRIWNIDPLWESLNKELISRRHDLAHSYPHRFGYSFSDLVKEIEIFISKLDDTEKEIMNDFKKAGEVTN